MKHRRAINLTHAMSATSRLLKVANWRFIHGPILVKSRTYATSHLLTVAHRQFIDGPTRARNLTHAKYATRRLLKVAH